MTEDQLRRIVGEIRSGALSDDQALDKLRNLPFEDLGFANVDHHRTLRQGFPEVIYGAGKTAEHVEGIVQSMLPGSHNILVTRATTEQYDRVKAIAPTAVFHERARAIAITRDETMRGKGTVLVISAGTSDIPVAEEAIVTLKVMGNRVEEIYDVGVSGLHRLLSRRERLAAARVLIVVA